jgi:hypothetical protein
MKPANLESTMIQDQDRIIPGVRQDAEGRSYRIKQYANGKQEHVYCSAPELTPRAKRAMTPVIVQSMAYRAAKDIQPKNAVQAAKIKAILDRGPTYESLACYQSTSQME